MKTIAFVLSLLTLTLVGAHSVQAATVSISAPKEVSVGEQFQVVFFLNQAENIDTVRLQGAFTQSHVDLLSMATTDQLESRSPSTYFLQSNGQFSYGAFSLDDPRTGSLKAGIFTFRAKKLGVATISLQNGSLVLSSGSNQLNNLPKATILITESKDVVRVTSTNTTFLVESASHPDENTWYSNGDISLSWDVKGDSVKQLFFGFDDVPEGLAEIAVEPKGSRQVTAPKNGIWYAHIIAVLNDGTKQRRDFRVQVDKDAPRAFAVSVDYEQPFLNTPNFLRFTAIDDVSGIAQYEIFDNDELLATSTLAYFDITGFSGEHSFVVKAKDFAGNVQSGQLEIVFGSQQAQKGISWLWLLLIILILVIAALLLGYVLHGHEKIRQYLVHRRQKKTVKKRK